ncbi:MAG: hypothetical protein QW666_04325 [Candidatus Woesearchaeota archaeon]
MAFVRVKKLKGKEYAYLVENTWQDKGSRQKVKAYLGRVVKPLRQKDTTVDITGMQFQEAVLKLVKQELLNHGFNENLENEGVKADLANKSFVSGKRNIVLALNEGFLCSQTLNEVLSFKPEGHEEQAGEKLATVLVEAGLKLPKDVFVTLFEKVYK